MRRLPKAPVELWEELGLFEDQQPVLLAGKLEIVRERVTALLDAPYNELPASAINAISGPSSDDVPVEMRKPASKRTLQRMRHLADLDGWTDLGEAVSRAGFTVEQEAT